MSAAIGLWLIPFGLVVALVEALGDLVTGHATRARAVLSGWTYNLLHFRRLRASRKRTQKLRRLHDRDLRELTRAATQS